MEPDPDEVLRRMIETQRQQLDLEKQRNADLKRTLNTSQSDYDVIRRTLASIVNGELGGRIGLTGASEYLASLDKQAARAAVARDVKADERAPRRCEWIRALVAWLRRKTGR